MLPNIRAVGFVHFKSIDRPPLHRYGDAPLIMLLAGAVLASPASAQTESAKLSTEIERSRNILRGLSGSPLGKDEAPRLEGLLTAVESLIEKQHAKAAIETMSSAIPGIAGLRRASTGWDDSNPGTGKGIEALTKEWEEVGRALQLARPGFPVATQAGESSFVRALAEQSVGQIDEQYAVAVDYGRISGASAGAYYLGRAEGHLAWALFLSGLPKDSVKDALTLPSLGMPLAALEEDIVSAYAKHGSTSQHGNFIIANSSLKLARELDQKGWRLGALITMTRSRLAWALATMPSPSTDQEKALAAAIDAIEARLAGSRKDQSIGAALVEKARLALEKSQAGGDSAGYERLRAAALAGVVLPSYLEIVGMDPIEEGSKK
ncbi:MAG: hypothetical protein JJE39_15125 [Vicinamibacteria bacterium]|nr:hypothetical protein [Vicinamibacteria bacterium]